MPTDDHDTPGGAPAHLIMMQMLRGRMICQAIGVVAELAIIADRLKKGPLGVEELAVD